MSRVRSAQMSQMSRVSQQSQQSQQTLPAPDEIEQLARRHIAQRCEELDRESDYYWAAIESIVKDLSDAEKEPLDAWLTHLAQMNCSSLLLRELRSRLLFLIFLTLLVGERGLKLLPPAPIAGEPLPDPRAIRMEDFPPPTWQEEPWDPVTIPVGFPCPIHACKEPCPDLALQAEKYLDDEFRFFLWLARRYITMIKDAPTVERLMEWLDFLARIGPGACPLQRGTRNDHAQVLIGFARDGRLAGPFLLPPPNGALPPLLDTARISAERFPITDPVGTEAEDFIAQQPFPEEGGAFCYVAITGDLEESGPKAIPPSPKPQPPNRPC